MIHFCWCRLGIDLYTENSINWSKLNRMKSLLTLGVFLIISSISIGQTTHQVCIECPASTTCSGKTGTFTPGNLIIQQGDMIQFTTTLVALSGYTGSYHNIEFAGYPANNVDLYVSTTVWPASAQITTVTTPPFNTPGTFDMECTNFNHCILAEYPCPGSYSVTVLPNCAVSPGFNASATTVCEGSTIDFTNSSTGATNYDWQIDGATFSTSTDAQYSFTSAGSFEIKLVADNGTCEDSTTVTINVDPAADAGSDNSQNVCTINDSIDLNTLVSGSSGGTWQETTSSGQFDAGTGYFDYSGLTAQNYTFDYVITGTGVCPNDTAEMTITVNQQPNATLTVTPSGLTNYDSVYVDFTPNGAVGGTTYLWEFCDGNTGAYSSSFYYSWSTGGNYCVCVTIDNNNGCSEQYCDSSIVVQDITGINEELKEQSLKIYPNPTSDMINVDLSEFEGEITVMITDLKGREIFTDKSKGGAIYTTSILEYSKGGYFINVISENRNEKVLFIVK